MLTRKIKTYNYNTRPISLAACIGVKSTVIPLDLRKLKNSFRTPACMTSSFIPLEKKYNITGCPRYSES